MWLVSGFKRFEGFSPYKVSCLTYLENSDVSSKCKRHIFYVIFHVVFRPVSVLLSLVKDLLKVTNISQGLGTYKVVPVHVTMAYRNGGRAPFILSLRRDWGEWLVWHPAVLPTGESAHGIRRIGGWVSPRSDLDALEHRNIAVRLAIVSGLVGCTTGRLILSRVLRKWLQYCIRGQTLADWQCGRLWRRTSKELLVIRRLRKCDLCEILI